MADDPLASLGGIPATAAPQSSAPADPLASLGGIPADTTPPPEQPWYQRMFTKDTALTAPLSPSQQQETEGIKNLFKGNFKEGAGQIWDSEVGSAHIIKGSPIEKAVRLFNPNFEGGIAPGEAEAKIHQNMAAIENPVVNLSQFVDKNEHPVLKALSEAAQSITSPSNIAMLAASGGLGMIKGAKNLATLHRVVSAGFGLQSVAQAYEHVADFKKAFDEGDANEAVYQMTHAVLSGALTLLSARGAAGKETPLIGKGDKAAAGAVGTSAVSAGQALGAAVKEYGGEAVAKAAGKVKGALFGGTVAETAPELINKIGQVGEDPDVIGRALKAVNYTGESYSDLKTGLDQKVRENDAAVDKLTDAKPNPIVPSQLMRLTPIPGSSSLAVDSPIATALQQMKDFYEKSENPAGAAQVDTWQKKLNSTGLTATEINDIAQQHGKDLSRKAFNANGELSTGVTKIAAENTRAAVKDILHRNVPETQAIDAQTSDLIKGRNLFGDLDEKIQKREAKQTKEGAIQKGAEWWAENIGKFIGLFTGSTKPTDISPELKLEDVEANLPKYLKRLKELESKSPAPTSAAPASTGGTMTGTPASKVGPTRTVSIPAETGPNPTRRDYGLPSEPAIDFQDSDILGDEPDQKTRGHEHGHGLVGHVLGIEPSEIRTPEHPVNQIAAAKGRRVHATTTFEIPDEWFDGDNWKLTPENLSKMLTVTMAGLASDEIHQGVERDLNPAGHGDQRTVRKLLDDAKVPLSRREGVVNKAYKAARAILDTPHARDIILENRDVREPGLDRSLHVSNERLKQIYKEYDRRVNEANTGRSTE